MACTSVTGSNSQVVTSPREIKKEHGNLRGTFSGKDMCTRAGIRQSYSDNHLCYSVNRIRASATQPKLKHSRSMFNFQLPGSIVPKSIRSFLFEPETNIVDLAECNELDEEVEVGMDEKQEKRTNWVQTLLEVRTHWRGKQQRDVVEEDEATDQACDDENGQGCEVDYNEEGVNGKTSVDRESFSKLLTPVTWSDTKHFSQLAFLCNMAYAIPEMKATDLRRYYGLEFVTSSLIRKAEAEATKAKFDQDNTGVPGITSSPTESNSQNADTSKRKHISSRPSVAYEIAASAASYVQSRAKNLLSLTSEQQQKVGNVTLEDNAVEEGSCSPRVYKSEVAAYVTATTMTAVIAAGEKEKEEAARDLQSLHSSPCEWFVCDDTSIYTRCFVIQGSDSVASWQANLFFDPIKFEGTDVLVHRGIYEAAKGIYKQFMPQIVEHLNRYGERAKLQFTGHSLGGSLSLLVSLMLLTRKVVKPSALRPVVTFGSPFVFCGGQKILTELGLDESHVHCIIMHRDIVPRAFSCNYPAYAAQLLKRLHRTFRSHPCLNKNKLLYTPMGKVFILQPNEESSPPHPLLPPGSAVYALENPQGGSRNIALMAFLNSPHPLETLSDPTAYGADGSILRDHDSSNYLKAMNGVIRQNTKEVVRRVRKQRNLLWPLLATPSPHAWSHERNLNGNLLSTTEEVMTGV